MDRADHWTRLSDGGNGLVDRLWENFHSVHMIKIVSSRPLNCAIIWTGFIHRKREL
jgi:hypothetical protein